MHASARTSEQWFTVLGKEFFICLEHAIEPWQQILGAVIGMQDDRDAVVLGHGPHVHGQCDGSNGTGIGKFESFAGHEGSAPVRNLNDDG